jgi:hypothetical protein
MTIVSCEEPPGGTERESAVVPAEGRERTAPSRRHQPAALLSAARCTASSTALRVWDALLDTNSYTH